MPSKRAPAAGAPGDRIWRTSLQQSFRLLPGRTAALPTSSSLKIFLESDGRTRDYILSRLEYEPNRAGAAAGAGPSPKRYRDPRQVYRAVGMVYEEEVGGVHLLRVTELGKAVLRWLGTLNENNYDVLGKYLAYALTACQLRNPTREGRVYDQSVKVFPFGFIWRAMLALEGKISSDELSRAIFKVTDEASLDAAIEAISQARAAADPTLMGVPTETQNDRIIPWMSMASFGWTLIHDKERTGENAGYYIIPEKTKELLKAATTVRHAHRDFDPTDEHAVRDYVERISRAASLPKDVR